MSTQVRLEHASLALYAAYLGAGGPARLTRRGDFTMVIAQFGHFWEMALEDFLAPDASAATKAHSLERIDESLAMTLRVEQIDAVLDWVGGVR